MFFAQLVAFLDDNKFRHIVDKYDGNRYMKLTNAIGQTVYQVTDLYKNRWQIGQFLMWLRQHLKIKF